MKQGKNNLPKTIVERPSSRLSKKNVSSKNLPNPKPFKVTSSMPIMSRIISEQKKPKVRKLTEAQKEIVLRTKHITLNNLEENIELIQQTPLDVLHELINNKKSLKENEKIVYYLMALEPFSSQLGAVMGKAKEEPIRRIAFFCKSEYFCDNTIIFKYGSLADKFYMIFQGKVDIICPYNEAAMLTEEEYVGYLLRLRRYNEKEILNNVLILNSKTFSYGDVNFDIWIKTAYNTLIRLKTDPYFISKDSYPNKNKKKSPRKKEEAKNNSIELQGFDDGNDIYETFEEREKKYLVLKLEEEIELTIKIAFPELYKEVLVDTRDKKKVSVLRKAVNKIDPDIDINSETYIKRILPPHFEYPQKATPVRKRVTVLKYLFIKQLGRGEIFGDILSDSITLFTKDQLDALKQANNNDNMKLHQFNSFRLVTAIIVSKDTYLCSISKKCYIESVKNANDKLNFKKIQFILQNKMFSNSNIKSLIKAYSICFVKRKLKQGEYLIKENDSVDKSNAKIIFIYDGEFESRCNKSISQMDEIIKEFGYGEKIKESFPEYLNDLIGPPYYEDLITKVHNIKLNYLLVNDIVGISEVLSNNKYAFSVICSSKEATVYEVNAHILRLLIESDKNIRTTKDKIIQNKYKINSDILLLQRKMKIERFFSLEKAKMLSKPEKQSTDNRTDQLHKSNSALTIGKNTTSINNTSVILNPSNKKESTLTLSTTYHFKSKSVKTSARTSAKKRSSQTLTVQKKFPKVPKENDIFEQKGIANLDLFLANTSGKFSFLDIRKKNAELFNERFKIKKSPHHKNKNMRSLFHICKRTNKRLLSAKISDVLPNLKVSETIDCDNSFQIKYDENKKQSSGTINPLVFDDFNRTYNTCFYYKKLFKAGSSKNFDFTLKISDDKDSGRNIERINRNEHLEKVKSRRKIIKDMHLRSKSSLISLVKKIK